MQGTKLPAAAPARGAPFTGASPGNHRDEHGAGDDRNDTSDPANPQCTLTADGVRDKANNDVRGDSGNVVPGLQGYRLGCGEAIALEPGGNPGVHAIDAELADEVSGPNRAGGNDELAGEQNRRARLGRLGRNDQQVGIEVHIDVAGSLDDLLKTATALSFWSWFAYQCGVSCIAKSRIIP